MITSGRRVVCITGANGFLGAELCRRFFQAGWEVRAGVRHPESYRAIDPRQPVFHCDLPDRLNEGGFVGADVCIHAAYSTRGADAETARRVNEAGSRAVLAACRGAGVGHLVFVSSCSAHEAALSYYGRSKFAFEQQLDPGRDLAIRPGLIIGRGGLFERMCETIRSSGVIPLFDGGRQIVQTIHLDDAARGIVLAVEQNRTGRIVLAEPEGIEMRELLRAVAGHLGRKPLFVPFPAGLALAVMRAIEAVGVRLPVTSENLLGLKGMIHQESAADLASLGLVVHTALQSVAEVLRELH
ncbi:NAD-dependent epimerase/dehydratase family protein [Candidatus Poribacteria bacterium]|nr:NAD-dependent epimerase/dehydratase family protein [Candidatus Poribacteria bacterium]